MKPLRILDPNKLPICAQSYDQMPIINGCKMCSNCSKQIHDFRKMSPLEITIKHASTLEPLCGIYSDAKNEKPKNIMLSKAKLLMLSIGSYLSNPIESISQKTEPIEIIDIYR